MARAAVIKRGNERIRGRWYCTSYDLQLHLCLYTYRHCRCAEQSQAVSPPRRPSETWPATVALAGARI